MKRLDLTKEPKNPFRVPDDYFKNLTSQIMEQLPERKAEETCVFIPFAEKKGSNAAKRRKLWVYGLSHASIAAAICGIICGVSLYQSKSADQSESSLAPLSTNQVSAASNETDEYIDDVCEYAMISTNDVFAFATENE